MSATLDDAPRTGALHKAAPCTVVLATRSEDKRRELAALCASLPVRVVTLEAAGVVHSVHEDGVERYETFAENALAKAHWYFARTRVSAGACQLVVADDSGLVVDALDGMPGVRSKRWSGRTDVAGAELDRVNVTHLQRALERAGASTDASRSAHYVCAAACVWSTGELVVTGRTHGRVRAEPVGGGGFGYDPVFHSDDLGMTFGEALPAAKASVSHRGRALRALMTALQARGVLPRS